jgi:hypothetical protein
MDQERVTVRDASLLLGISEGAVRKRMARGSLQHERDADGKVWVLLRPGARGRTRAQDVQDAGQDTGIPTRQDNPELVEELRDRIAYLERQVEEEREARRRADTLMARLMDRIPELEAPRDTTRVEDTGHDAGETRVTRVQDAGEDATSPQAPFPRPERSWWRRFFGFE